MATKKPKYNPEDVERWVTVKGARIPIMKDGSFGVGEDAHKAAYEKSVHSQYYIDVDAKAEQKLNKEAERLGNQIVDEDMGARSQAKLINETADKLQLNEWNRNVFHQNIIDYVHYKNGDISKADYEEKQRLKSKFDDGNNNWEKVADAGIAKQHSRNARYDTSRANPLQPRIERKAGLVFAVSKEGNVLKTWREEEFTERKYANYLKRLNNANPNK